MTTNTVLILMGIGLGIVILFGIYKLATSNLHERSTLKPGTSTNNHASLVKTIVAIVFTILLFIALYIAYEILT